MIPQYLQAIPHWLVWRYEKREGKQTKVPYIAMQNGGHAKTNDPQTWRTYTDAVKTSDNGGGYAGIGFVFTDTDIVGVDLDHCINPDGTLQTWADEIVTALDSYTEVTPSGTGLHILTRGKLPTGRRRQGQIEMYDASSPRYFTVTGTQLENTPDAINERSAQLQALHARIFTKPPEAPAALPAQPVFSDDLIVKARAAKNGAAFVALYDRGDIASYAGDESSADAALCEMLAFWTGKDAAQIDRLFRQSALMREKWNTRHSADGSTYGQMTIAYAINNCKDVYTHHAPSEFAELRATQDDQLPEKKALGWHWLTMADAYAERPPREYVVEKLLPIPSLTSIYGAPGGLKTMLTLDLAMAVLAGHPFLDTLPGIEKNSPFVTHPSPVIWVDVDNGERRSLDRIKALGIAHKVAPDAPLFFVSFPTPPFVASDVDAVGYLLETVGVYGARLVIFDNLGTISGGADENSNQMVAVMSGLRALAERGNCAVVVIHHRNKGGGAGSNPRKGNALRGHSSIEGALDLALLVEREDGNDAITIESTKTRDIPVWPFDAMWTYRQDEAGELLEGRFWGAGRPDIENTSKPNSDRAYELILVDINGEMQQGAIVEMLKPVKIGRNATLTALAQLEREGLLLSLRGDKNTRLYRLTPAGEKQKLEILYNK